MKRYFYSLSIKWLVTYPRKNYIYKVQNEFGWPGRPCNMKGRDRDQFHSGFIWSVHILSKWKKLNFVNNLWVNHLMPKLWWHYNYETAWRIVWMWVLSFWDVIKNDNVWLREHPTKPKPQYHWTREEWQVDVWKEGMLGSTPCQNHKL